MHKQMIHLEKTTMSFIKDIVYTHKQEGCGPVHFLAPAINLICLVKDVNISVPNSISFSQDVS